MGVDVALMILEYLLVMDQVATVDLEAAVLSSPTLFVDNADWNCQKLAEGRVDRKRDDKSAAVDVAVESVFAVVLLNC